MYRSNKFENIKTATLLKFVQAETIETKTAEFKKAKTKKNSRRKRDLASARKELVERLEKMDRNSPEFFPVGSMVDYTGKEAKVIAPVEDAKQLYIKCSGEDFLVKVDPSKLTLINIREHYEL